MKILLKNATIYPITSKCIYNSDLLIMDEKIAFIGKYTQLSGDTQVIDCTGKYIFPGFIDVHTHVGLYDEGTGWAGNDANETIDISTPHVRSLDGILPLDSSFRDALQSGITTVHIMPGSANVIGGTTCIVKTHGNNIEKMLLKEPAGLKIALGENPKSIHSKGKNSSITRMGIMGLLRETFYRAIHCDNPDSFRMQPIIKALKREIPVRIHAHRADDIMSAMRFADEFNLDLRIEHCTEGHLIADVLQDRGLKVCVGPTLTRRSKVELRHKTWKTYDILTKAGVEVSITTDHPYTPIQYLNVCAAIAMREGLEEQKALEGITILPARNLNIDHLVGSLEVGKQADLAVWSYHPFYFLAKPLLTMVEGKIVFKNV
ncbi:amidohydrolase [Priestia taiwanensis]|nr:amidohydrolase [Priestia taiwanensis]